MELLKQIKGVGTLIALTYLLTLEDPHRFGKSRDVGGYLGLQPGRQKLGPERATDAHQQRRRSVSANAAGARSATHLWVRSVWTVICRRWGLKLAERGGRSGKKRAIVATARKLAVLLHHLWVSGEVYDPLHNSSE